MGYRVVVPDMLGYGGTDKPTDATAYSTRKLCDDLVALLDLINVRKAVRFVLLLKTVRIRLSIAWVLVFLVLGYHWT
jgi:hypothetical protein